MRGVLLRSKHSGDKYLQIKKEKAKGGFIKANVERSIEVKVW